MTHVCWKMSITEDLRQYFNEQAKISAQLHVYCVDPLFSLLTIAMESQILLCIEKKPKP